MPPLAALELSDGGLRFTLFFAVLLPAVVMASRQSTYLVDYYIVVACFNRFVRRLLDWSGGEYDPRPISSLLPLLVGGLMLAVAAWQAPHFIPRHRRAFYLLLAALAYAAALGVMNGLAMLYGLLEYIAPLGLLFYGLAIRVDLATLDRWLNTLAKVAVIVAAYGWFQWATMPPWFASWIEWSGMWTSMGHPEAFRTAACSTLESRGPYAWFLASAAVPMLLSPRWRRIVGLPGAMLVVSAILPSTVRSAWGILVVGIGAFAMIRGGQSWSRLALAVAVVIAALLEVKAQMPETERLFERMETVTDLPNDGSFRGRTRIATEGIGIVLANPVGYGLGSSGLSGKISGATGVIGDNGVWELLTTFGVPGLLLLLGGMRILVGDVMALQRECQSDHAALGIAQLMAGIAALAFANWVAGPYSGMSLMILGAVIGVAYRRARQLSAAAQQPQRIDRWVPSSVH